MLDPSCGSVDGLSWTRRPVQVDLRAPLDNNGPGFRVPLLVNRPRIGDQVIVRASDSGDSLVCIFEERGGRRAATNDCRSSCSPPG